MSATNHESHAGGCLCGAVRYRVTGEALFVTYCHCGMCRKSSGGVTAAWAAFNKTQVSWEAGRLRHYNSSEKLNRGFCGTCGSSLTFERDNFDKIGLAVATLDDPGRYPPQRHIYTADCVPWLRLEDDLPRFARQAPGIATPED